MALSSPKSQPTFFWQAALILLPLAALVAIGAFSLRQDKILAEHEASQRAVTIAEDLAAKLWPDLLATKAMTKQTPFFRVDSSGRLLFPPPVAAFVRPQPFDPGQLNNAQATLWNQAQQSETAGTVEPAIGYYREFLDSKPPASFVGPAYYALGLLLATSGQSEAAFRSFTDLLQSAPQATGESGIPLAPLAQLKLLELGGDAQSSSLPGQPNRLDNFCSNVVFNPNPLSPELLSRAAALAGNPEVRTRVARWQKTWGEQEFARELFLAASPQITNAIKSSIRGAAPTATPERASVTAAPLTPQLGRALSPKAPFPGRVGEAAPPKTEALHVPVLFWFAGPTTASTGERVTTSARTWLAVGTETSAGEFLFACEPEYELGAGLDRVVEQARHIPAYFGIGLEVAGRKLTWPAPDLRLWHEVNYFGRRGGGQKKEYSGGLATNLLASALAPGSPPDGLKVSVYLTSPSVLFKLQRARTFWFGAVILASALASWVGLIAAWRAFHRQLRLNEMKSDFVSSVSHELRAPIASVRLMAESLERGKVSTPSKQQEYFHFIVQECRRLSSLIENVLDFSRIEQGRKQYEFEPVDLVALTRQTVRFMETYAADRQVQLRFAVEEPQLPAVNYQACVDGKAIQQALVNLIDNAVKHSPQGETVTVGIEIRRPAPEGRNVVPEAVLRPPPSTATGLNSSSQVSETGTPASSICAWVEDHGDGIPASEHEKIFERFYRRGSELRRETQGVGIGLSIVKHVAEAHRGRVTVCSDVGQGSRFTLELPVSPPAMNAADEVEAHEC